ncbi:MAG TPA: YciI-like protein [Croceibacterium sp.]|nr:YciI-like protein [Croceibacterium sp.]
MKHFLLTYALAADYLARRPPLRAAHLALARAAVARGELLLGGALEPAEEAVLLFAGEDPGAAEAFARADPYVAEGLVTAWRVREWRTVVGAAAAAPAPGD